MFAWLYNIKIKTYYLWHITVFVFSIGFFVSNLQIHIQYEKEGKKEISRKRTALSFLWPVYISDHEAGSQEGSFIETFAFIISKINCHNERLSIFFRSLPFRHAFFQWGLLFQFQLVWPWSCTHIRSFISFRNIPAY